MIEFITVKGSKDVILNFSTPENTSEEVLMGEILRLKKLESSWKNAKIWAGALAAAMAVLVGISEVLEGRVAGQRDTLQERLAGNLRQANNIAIAKANERAAEASMLAKQYQADIAKANHGAAEANRVAEQERLDRLKIEARLSPRTLTEAQRVRLRDLLARFRGVTYELGVTHTPEALRFASTLDSVLESSGWAFKEASIPGAIFKVSVNGKNAEQVLHSGIGIGVSLSKSENYVVAAAALVSALRAEGLDVTSGQIAPGDPSPNNIRVFIGSKE